MPEYSKDIDAVLLACSVLKRLGSGEVDTFEQRLRSQKIQYLAQVFGISPTYGFNLYIWGPYSPSLAKDLFALQDNKVQVRQEPFTPQELEDRFTKAEGFIKKQNTRQLELTTTLHWLKIAARLPGEDAIIKLKEIKKANDEEIVKTKKLVDELCQAA